MPGTFSFVVESPQKHAPFPGSPLLRAVFLGALALFILFLMPVEDSSSNQGGNCLLAIEGIHRFSPGDSPGWASVEYDDARWTSVHIPGSWQSQGLKSLRGMGWYRIHFSASLERQRSLDGFLGLSLGRIGNADEVFLNGSRIGGEGIIAGQFVEAQWKERLYRIPKGLLRFDGNNVIAVRVMNTSQAGGILSTPLCIGEYGRLLAESHRRELSRYALEVGILIVFAASTLAGVLLSLIGSRDLQYILFALFVFLCAITYTLDSLLFYETGLKNPLVQRATTTLTFLVSGVGLWLLMVLCREPRRTWLGAIVASLVVIGLVSWFCSTSAAYWILVEIWQPLFLVALATGVFLAVRGRRRKLYGARPVLYGLIGLAVAFLIDAKYSDFPVLKDPVFPSEYGVLIFSVGITWALLVRYHHIRKGFRVLSGKILDAQEEERRRLAREIHDGVGQPLLAVKLHLQMLDAGVSAGKPIGKEALPPLISEVSEAIEELRRVTMDLRPVLSREGSLAEALRWYGMKFGEQAGMTVSVQGDDSLDVPVRIRDHVFRIYQEALSNAGKHAAADQVGVRIERKGQKLSLSIKDNGRGFDPSRAMGEARGIGLSTMKERAELLYGTLHIKSAPGRGTAIEIEVPL